MIYISLPYVIEVSRTLLSALKSLSSILPPSNPGSSWWDGLRGDKLSSWPTRWLENYVSRCLITHFNLLVFQDHFFNRSSYSWSHVGELLNFWHKTGASQLIYAFLQSAGYRYVSNVSTINEDESEFLNTTIVYLQHKETYMQDSQKKLIHSEVFDVEVKVDYSKRQY